MSCHNSTLQKHKKVSYRYYHREIFAKGTYLQKEGTACFNRFRKHILNLHLSKMHGHGLRQIENGVHGLNRVFSHSVTNLKLAILCD